MRVKKVDSPSVRAAPADAKLEYVEVSALVSDGEYQRPVDEKRAMKIASEWDSALFGRLLIGLRPDGTMVIIDGHHRVKAATILGLTHLPAAVINVATVTDEAIYFHKVNTSNKRLSAVDRFRARLAAGESPEIKIGALLATTGHAVGHYKDCDGSPKKLVNCAATLICLWKSDEKALATVWLLAAAMCENRNGVESDLLEALHVLEICLADGHTLASDFWVKRLTQGDYVESILAAYRSVKALSKKGGKAYQALCVAIPLNRSLSANKLVLKADVNG